MEEYAGRGSVIRRAGVEKISVWAWLYGVMVHLCRTIGEHHTELKTSQVFNSIIPTYP